MKIMLALFVVAACALGAGAASAQNQTEIGRLTARAGGGTAVMLLVDLPGPPTAAYGALFVSDRYNIKTNMIAMDRPQLLKLRELIDATILKLDEAAAAASPK